MHEHDATLLVGSKQARQQSTHARVSSSLASALRAVYDGTSQVCPLQTTVVAALHIHDLEPEEIYSVYVQYCIHIYLFIFTSPLLLTAALLHCITHRFSPGLVGEIWILGLR